MERRKENWRWNRRAIARLFSSLQGRWARTEDSSPSPLDTLPPKGGPRLSRHLVWLPACMMSSDQLDGFIGSRHTFGDRKICFIGQRRIERKHQRFRPIDESWPHPSHQNEGVSCMCFT